MLREMKEEKELASREKEKWCKGHHGKTKEGDDGHETPLD